MYERSNRTMAKYQRYAGYAHEAPDPIIPKPDVPPDPMIVTVQDGLPILFEPCEAPAIRVVHPTNPNAPSRNVGVTMLYVPPQGTVAFGSHGPEEVYAVMEGAGIMHFTKGPRPIKKGDFIYLAPWCEHGIENTGIDQMVVMVITSPTNP
jgi:mannose-6-phosphate isomerase-like protein (cupin superfamily)